LVSKNKKGCIKLIKNDYVIASLKEIVEQLEFCKFECEGGSLENNIAFLELKRRAELEETEDIK
jgi:hypothetical protein